MALAQLRKDEAGIVDGTKQAVQLSAGNRPATKAFQALYDYCVCRYGLGPSYLFDNYPHVRASAVAIAITYLYDRALDPTYAGPKDTTASAIKTPAQVVADYAKLESAAATSLHQVVAQAGKPVHEWRFRAERVDLPRVWREARLTQSHPVVLVSNRGDTGDQALLVSDVDYARLSSAGKFVEHQVVGSFSFEKKMENQEIVRILRFRGRLDATQVSQLSAYARDLREKQVRAKVEVF